MHLHASSLGLEVAVERAARRGDAEGLARLRRSEAIMSNGQGEEPGDDNL
jgi:hypothetical protein